MSGRKLLDPPTLAEGLALALPNLPQALLGAIFLPSAQATSISPRYSDTSANEDNSFRNHIR